MHSSLVLLFALVASAFAQRQIINGDEAKPYSFPFMVNIKVRMSNSMGYLELGCGGSLVDKQWVLTAAHCLPATMDYMGSKFDLESVTTTFAEHDISKEEGPEVKIVNGPEAAHVHEGYSDSSFDNDIGMIKLSSPVEFNEKIQPVSMTCQDTVVSDGTELTLVGWGLTNKKQETDVLLTGKDHAINRDECSTFLVGYGVTLTDRMLCAGGDPAAQCSGDSGGPVLMNNDSGSLEQVGIVSFGLTSPITGCLTETPNVQSSVANLRDWIAKTSGIQAC